MGADFYSSELYWNNLKPLDFAKARRVAESIDDSEEKEKVLSLIDTFEGYDLEGNFYHRGGSVKEIGPISVLIAAYQGYGDPSESNSLMTDINELSEHSEILNAIGFTLNPKELYNNISEKRIAPLTQAISKLTAIPDDVIEILSGYEGHLNLNGLVDLSDRAAEILSNHQGFLSLWDLTELSDTAAESLSKHQGTISFGNVMMSQIATAVLADHGDILCFNGFGSWLTALTDETAASLVNYKNDELSLTGLTEISEKTAHSLSKYKGSLLLNGLTHLSDPVAEALSAHQGFLQFDEGLTLTDQVAENLSKHIGGLCFFLREITDSVALRLSKIEGDLLIYGLSELTDSAAESFSFHRGELILDQIEVLSEKGADAISHHNGLVRMFNLESKSPKAWEVLQNRENFALSEQEAREKRSMYGVVVIEC